MPIDESSEELQPVSVSERLADRRPNPEHQYRESALREHLTHLQHTSVRELSKQDLVILDGVAISTEQAEDWRFVTP